MPSQHGVGRDKRRRASQYGASEPLPKHPEPSLRIVQLQPASRQLCFSVRFSSRRNAITSPCSRSRLSEQRGEEHLERKHAVSLANVSPRVFRHYGVC